MIAVAVVEDDDLVRTAWVELLNDTPGMRCALACASAEEALDLLADHEPDVVLMDIQLPGMSGIEAVRRARPVLEGCDFLMLTVHDDDQSVFQSLCAGASGYLLKDSAPEEVIKGIRDCVSGGSAITPGIARMVVDSSGHDRTMGSRTGRGKCSNACAMGRTIAGSRSASPSAPTR